MSKQNPPDTFIFTIKLTVTIILYSQSNLKTYVVVVCFKKNIYFIKPTLKPLIHYGHSYEL